ncbi:murein biosynthesis integral membrane protein MurJ [Candidatus Uhrbacteria bacterium]|nr:murein biosynthesis integral membrane protein MurJ [Candidatus Uhrbacteria bacterium]
MITWFKKMWNGETDGLTAAALIVGASSLASRLLGLVRDRVLAGTFGAGSSLDAYYAAFRLPDTVYNLLILGAISAGFIPVFTEYLETKGKESAAKLAAQVLTTVGACVAVASALVAVFAPVIMPLIVPGFDAETLQKTIELTRVMSVSPLLLGLSAVIGGVMQSMKRYVGFALAPVFYNFGIIVGTIVLSPTMGIMGAAIGVVAGAFMHFLVQASTLPAFPLGKLPWPSFSSAGVRRILALMGPRTAALGISQVNLVFLLALATTIEPGAVSVFNLANNLQMFPVGLIGISFAIAAFPSLAKAHAIEDDEGYRHALSAAARKIIFLIIPAMAVFILLRAQIVRLALGAGEFNWNDTIRTADALAWFAVSLVAQSLVPLLARAFYALQDTWTPFWISIISEAVIIGLAIVLREPFGVMGLAMAFSAAAIVQCLLLGLFLRRMFGQLGKGETLISTYKTSIATVALCTAAFPVRQWLGTIYNLEATWQVVLQASGTLVAGGLAFFVTAWLVRSPELVEFRMAAEKRLFKKARLVEGAEEASGMAKTH